MKINIHETLMNLNRGRITVDQAHDEIKSAMCEANACPQLYEGWRDRSDKSYYNEKRILIFTPCHEDITMRWRIIDSQFMDLCIEASHWKKLDEPAFV